MTMESIEKRPEGVKERKDWYRRHHDEIKADIDKMGFRDAAAKWGYPVLMTTHFYREPKSLHPAPAADSRANWPKRSTPDLPQFSEKWHPEVQIKWLEVWAASRSNR